MQISVLIVEIHRFIGSLLMVKGTNIPKTGIFSMVLILNSVS